MPRGVQPPRERPGEAAVALLRVAAWLRRVAADETSAAPRAPRGLCSERILLSASPYPRLVRRVPPQLLPRPSNCSQSSPSANFPPPFSHGNKRSSRLVGSHHENCFGVLLESPSPIAASTVHTRRMHGRTRKQENGLLMAEVPKRIEQSGLPTALLWHPLLGSDFEDRLVS